jgi:hypothetical protein
MASETLRVSVVPSVFKPALRWYETKEVIREKTLLGDLTRGGQRLG